jgi:PAS domain S-box-containing protein
MTSANTSTNEVIDEGSYVLNQAEVGETRTTPEKEEKDAEPRFWEIFDSVSDGLFQIDLEGNFVLVNTAFATMIGYKPEELHSRNIKILQEYVSEEEIEAILTEITEKGRINERVIRLPQPDGSVRWIEVSIGMRRGKNGDSIGFEGIVREVTDRVRYERRLEALHRHATKLGSSTSVEEVAELTFDTIEQTLGFNLGSFSIVEGNLLREIHTRGVKTYTLFKLHLDGPGITVRAVRTRQTQLIPDIREDGDYIRGPAEGYYESLSELDVPVKVDGRVIAVINIESTKLNAFTDEDRKLVEILAGHVASTVQKIRLLEMERHYKAKIEALHRHASELASAVTIDEVAKTTLDAIEGVLGFPLGAFSIVKDDLLIPIYLKGIDIGSNRSLPLDGPGIVVRAVNARESQLVPDTRKDKDYILALVDGKNQTLSELAVPVVVNSEVKAVFNVESENLNSFNDEDKRLLEIFAEHVASTIGRLSEVERLRRSEEKFRTLLEESMDAATLIVGTTIIYANKRMAELVGLRDTSEVIGRSSLDFVADEDKEIVKTRTLGRQRGETHVNLYEFKMLTTDGAKIDVETYVSLIEYEGRPASLAFTRNITERKKMERELRDYAERLEEMVDERTRKLREAERMAAIGELAAMIGHDLRNPLTGIAGAAYFLKTKYGPREDDTIKKMLEIIENDIEYSNKIINDLLEYSRSINLELSATNSKRLVEEALVTFKVPENIRILNLTMDEPEIEVDIQKMRRVILNLVNNAIDAMPAGGEIIIRSKTTKENLELYFTDTGKGIPEEIIDKIWKPLFTTKAKGMGFGLSICKRVVESHGGTISVKSKIGEGTTFIITLPRVR